MPDNLNDIPIAALGDALVRALHDKLGEEPCIFLAVQQPSTGVVTCTTNLEMKSVGDFLKFLLENNSNVSVEMYDGSLLQ